MEDNKKVLNEILEVEKKVSETLDILNIITCSKERENEKSVIDVILNLIENINDKLIIINEEIKKIK